MKKIIALLMTVIMCVGFSSCGKSSADKSDKELVIEENYWQLYNGEPGIYVDIHNDGVVSNEEEEEIRNRLKEIYSDKILTVSKSSIIGLIKGGISLHESYFNESEEQYSSEMIENAKELDGVFNIKGNKVSTDMEVTFTYGRHDYDVYLFHNVVEIWIRANYDNGALSATMFFTETPDSNFSGIENSRGKFQAFDEHSRRLNGITKECDKLFLFNGEHVEDEKILQNLENKFSDSKVTVTEDSVKGLIKDDIPIAKGVNDIYYSNGEIRAEELDSIFKTDENKIETFLTVSIEDDIMSCKIYAYYGDNENKDDGEYFYTEISFKKPDTE